MWGRQDVPREDVQVVLAQEATEVAVNDDVSDVRANDVTCSDALSTCISATYDVRVGHSET